MAFTIGEVEVRFGAKIDRFEAQMNKAAKKLEGIGTTAKRMFGALAGAFAVGKMVQFSKTIMATADASAKHAKALGAQLEGMIGLQHAAVLSGASVDELDKSLDQMNKRLGSGKYGEMLSEIGLDSGTLGGMTADEKFIEIADAIGKIEDPARRTFVAMELLGRGGAKMIRMAMEGKGSIRAMAQEARDLGIALNETDAKKFENVNDNFERIQKAIKGAAQTMLIELAPAMDSIAKKAVDVGIAFNSWLKGGGKSDAQNGGAGGELAERYQDIFTLKQMRREGKLTQEEYDRFLKNALKDTERLRGVTQEVKLAEQEKVAAGKFKDEEARLQDVADSLAEKFSPDLSGKRAELDKLLAGGGIDQGVYAAAMEELNKKDPAYQQAEALQKEMQEAEKDIQRRAESIAKSVQTPLEAFEEKLREIAELEQSGALSADAAERARRKAWADAGGTGEAPPLSLGPDGKPIGTNTRGIAGGDVGALIAQQTLQKGAEDRQAAIQRLNEQQKTLLERIETNTRTGGGTWQ